MKVRSLFPASLCPFVYLAAAILMVSLFWSYKVPTYGFAWLPSFGEEFEPRMSKEFRDKSGYIALSNIGYDGQFYAQLALDPLILNPETKGAFDNFQFRARRPLFAMTANLAGGGNPRETLQAYSIQNLVFWLALAGILLRWLPPTCWENTFRYVCILYSVGLVGSIQLALLDGPAMTMIALSVLLADLGKPWLSAIVLGLAGLGKETCLLAVTVFGIPKSLEPKKLLFFGMRLLLVVLPLIGWLVYLSLIDGEPDSEHLGTSTNFSWPFAGWWRAVEVFYATALVARSFNGIWVTAAFLLAIPLQAIALIAMWRPANSWWRVGSTFALFSFFLGYATWEGFVGSAARICMPMTVAFNILAPRTSKWLVILLIGNLTTTIGFYSLINGGPRPDIARPQSPGEISLIRGSIWKNGWNRIEKRKNSSFRWASGDAEIVIISTEKEDFQAVLSFRTRAVAPMEVEIWKDQACIFRFDSLLELGREFEAEVTIHEGRNVISFKPVIRTGEALPGKRALSFLLFDPRLKRK